MSVFRCQLVIVQVFEKLVMMIVWVLVFFESVVMQVGIVLLYMRCLYILLERMQRLCFIVMVMIVLSWVCEQIVLEGFEGELSIRSFVFGVMVVLSILGVRRKFVLLLVRMILGVVLVSFIILGQLIQQGVGMMILLLGEQVVRMVRQQENLLFGEMMICDGMIFRLQLEIYLLVMV